MEFKGPDGKTTVAMMTFKHSGGRVKVVDVPQKLASVDWKEGAVNHYVLKGPAQLPVAFDKGKVEQGSYSQVRKVKMTVPTSFGKYQKPNGSVFVLKQIWRGKNTDIQHKINFEHEVGCLAFAQGAKDATARTHTVPLLASFEHVDPITKKTEYYMLFPCADGSLFDYWFTQKAKHSAKNKEHVKLMINQFIGLLKALDSFHQLSFKIEGGSPAPRHARHCDVKPANIFAFKNGLGDKTTPIFVLGDFGSVRFGGDKAIGDMSFRAPESQLKGVKESTKADIFSLGCCLLEYVTWLLKDNKAVEHFSDIRVEKDILGSTNDSFFTVDKTATIPTLKKSVTAWLNDLLKHPDCTPALREILNITEQNMMNPVAQTRLDAKQVITKLETTLKKI